MSREADDRREPDVIPLWPRGVPRERSFADMLGDATALQRRANALHAEVILAELERDPPGPRRPVSRWRRRRNLARLWWAENVAWRFERHRPDDS